MDVALTTTTLCPLLSARSQTINTFLNDVKCATEHLIPKERMKIGGGVVTTYFSRVFSLINFSFVLDAQKQTRRQIPVIGEIVIESCYISCKQTIMLPRKRMQHTKLINIQKLKRDHHHLYDQCPQIPAPTTLWVQARNSCEVCCITCKQTIMLPHKRMQRTKLINIQMHAKIQARASPFIRPMSSNICTGHFVRSSKKLRRIVLYYV